MSVWCLIGLIVLTSVRVCPCMPALQPLPVALARRTYLGPAWLHLSLSDPRLLPPVRILAFLCVHALDACA